MTLADPQAAKRNSWHGFVVVTGAAAMTLLCFLVLPLMQAIAKKTEADVLLTEVDTILPPPPEPPPPEPEQEPEPEEKPPELVDEMPPLDLAQLELALNPTMGGGWLAGDFGVKLDHLAGSTGSTEELFSEVDLDQKPRVVFDPAPVLTAKLRRKTPASVVVLFWVTAEGRVEEPSVFRSSDPDFEPAVLSAIRQWRFEPGKRSNQPVRFRMRLPFKFPKS